MPLREEDAGRFSQSVLQPNSNPSLLTARRKWRQEERKVIYIYRQKGSYLSISCIQKKKKKVQLETEKRKYTNATAAKIDQTYKS